MRRYRDVINKIIELDDKKNIYVTKIVKSKEELEVFKNSLNKSEIGVVIKVYHEQ